MNGCNEKKRTAWERLQILNRIFYNGTILRMKKELSHAVKEGVGQLAVIDGFGWLAPKDPAG
jgi:hypothetical protein